ncbi:MAG: hypothetical protein ACRENL_13260 [Candidatus Dormibacteria bacterium]
MKGFRRAQLRGSEELFRPTDLGDAKQDVLAVEVAAEVRTVPAAPHHNLRSVRLSNDEIDLLADAVQHLKFPHQQSGRPSMERFEQLETLRQKLLANL